MQRKRRSISEICINICKKVNNEPSVEQLLKKRNNTYFYCGYSFNGNSEVPG